MGNLNCFTHNVYIQELTCTLNSVPRHFYFQLLKCFTLCNKGALLHPLPHFCTSRCYEPDMVEKRFLKDRSSDDWSAGAAFRPIAIPDRNRSTWNSQLKLIASNGITGTSNPRFAESSETDLNTIQRRRLIPYR